MPAMQPGPNPGETLGLNAAMGSGAGLGIEGFDQELNFDESML